MIIKNVNFEFFPGTRVLIYDLGKYVNEKKTPLRESLSFGNVIRWYGLYFKNGKFEVIDVELDSGEIRSAYLTKYARNME